MSDPAECPLPHARARLSKQAGSVLSRAARPLDHTSPHEGMPGVCPTGLAWNSPRGRKSGINIDIRRSARISWIGAGPPLGAPRAREGVQRRSRKSARSSESLCLWRSFFFQTEYYTSSSDKRNRHHLPVETLATTSWSTIQLLFNAKFNFPSDKFNSRADEWADTTPKLR